METVALYIIGGIILFFALLLSLRAVVTLSYSEELSLDVRVLFLKIRILPKKQGGKRIRSMSRKKSLRIRRQLEEKRKKEREEARLKKEKKDAEKGTKKKKTLSDILDIVDLVVSLLKTVLKKFFGHLRVDVKRFKINVATGNPATTAIAYGAASAAISNMLEPLMNNKNVRGLKRADIDISCDFLSDAPSADIHLSFSLRVWQALHIGIAALMTFIKSKLSKASDEESPQDHKQIRKKKTKSK